MDKYQEALDILAKYKRAFEILKPHLKLVRNKNMETPIWEIYCDMFPTKEEKELIKDLVNDEI